MSPRFRVIGLVSLIVVTIVGFMLNSHSILGSVTAAENLTASAKSQLKNKLQEKRQLLEQVVNLHKYRIEQGVGSSTSVEYMKAQEAVLRVDIELCDTKEDRTRLYNEIIQLYTDHEKLIESQVKAKQLFESDLNEAKLARLEIEIELLKDQIN